MSKILTVLIPALLLGACQTIPQNPSVLVLPGSGKDFSQFRNDDQECRRSAYTQVKQTEEIGDDYDEDEGQQYYDILYLQCMYGKDHRVPIPGNTMYGSRQDWYPPPPPNMPAPR